MAEVEYKPKPGDIIRMEFNNSYALNEQALVLSNNKYKVLQSTYDRSHEGTEYIFIGVQKITKLGEISLLEKLVYGLTV